jgi:hypothetical protein
MDDDDELDHLMSAFCPCGPEFDEDATATDADGGDPVDAIVYRHKPMPT